MNGSVGTGDDQRVKKQLSLNLLHAWKKIPIIRDLFFQALRDFKSLPHPSQLTYLLTLPVCAKLAKLSINQPVKQVSRLFFLHRKEEQNKTLITQSRGQEKFKIMNNIF